MYKNVYINMQQRQNVSTVSLHFSESVAKGRRPL